MILPNRLRSVLRWMIHRERVEQELDAELQAYIDLAAAAKMREGIPAAEARRLARLELGGVDQTKERVRSQRHGGMLDTLWGDARVGARVLSKNPMFTAVAVLTLAVGIGGIAAIFSAVYGVLLRPLPYGDADRLVTIPEISRPPQGRRPAPLPKGADWPDNNHVLEGLSYFQPNAMTLLEGEEAKLVRVLRVTPNYLSVLKAKPLLGRDFSEDDGAAPQPKVALLSHGYWQQRFGGSTDVIGKDLRFVEGVLTVIGVMPHGFRAPRNELVEVWTAVSRDNMTTFAERIGRLRPEFSPVQAEAALNAIIKQIESDYPDSAVNRRTQVQPVTRIPTLTRNLLLLLFASAGFILLIAIINVANLMLSRSVSRTREIAVRSALGASRSRLVRQMLTESLLLAFLGSALGLLLAYGAFNVLLAQMPKNFPRLVDIHMDSSVLFFVLATTIVTALAFGIAPALSSSKTNLQQTLKEGARQASEGWRRRFFRQTLVGIEIGLAAVLLIGAVLLGSSFWNLLNQPLGFDTENVVAAHVYFFQSNRRTTEDQLRLFNEELLQRMKRYPQVESASVAMNAPVNAAFMYASYSVEDVRRADEAATDQVPPLRVEVSSDYFRTVKISFVEGRPFADDEQAVVINESMRRRHWPNSSPLGSRLKFAREDQVAPWFTIVGVVVDQNDKAARMTVNLPRIFKPCVSCNTLLVRTRTESAEIGAIIRKEIGSMDSTLPVDRLQTLDDMLAQSEVRADPRFRTTLFAAFAGTALLLALAGVYGTTSYYAAQRTREIGIRIAMGATGGSVLWLMMRQSMVPILIGIAAGLAGALALTRFLTTYLFEQSPTDPIVFAVVAAVLCLVALLANFVPIRRSALMDPMNSLRCD